MTEGTWRRGTAPDRAERLNELNELNELNALDDRLMTRWKVRSGIEQSRAKRPCY
ncbi:MAG: hypothetical protein ACREMH_08500 [Gemmatimonadales bacterium]